MQSSARYRFVIVATPGGDEQELEVECLTEASALDAAGLFAEDATRVDLWCGSRRLWSSLPQG